MCCALCTQRFTGKKQDPPEGELVATVPPGKWLPGRTQLSSPTLFPMYIFPNKRCFPNVPSSLLYHSAAPRYVKGPSIAQRQKFLTNFVRSIQTPKRWQRITRPDRRRSAGRGAGAARIKWQGKLTHKQNKNNAYLDAPSSAFLVNFYLIFFTLPRCFHWLSP